MHSHVIPAVQFNPLSADDLADIEHRFSHHSARDVGADLRDLRHANERENRAARVTQPLTFSLRSLLPSNIR